MYSRHWPERLVLSSAVTRKASQSKFLKSRVTCTEIWEVWSTAEVAVGNPARNVLQWGHLWQWGAQVAVCCFLDSLWVMREFLGSTWPLLKSTASSYCGSARGWEADGMWKLMSCHSQPPNRTAWSRLLCSYLLTCLLKQLQALL